jgi:hypothetical protein
MADLVAFFNAAWPPEPGAEAPTDGADGTLVVVVLVVAGLVAGGVLVAGIRRRQSSR